MYVCMYISYQHQYDSCLFPHWVLQGCGSLGIPFGGCLQLYNTMNIIKLKQQGVDPFTCCATGSIYSWNTFGRNFISFNQFLVQSCQEGCSFYHISSPGNSSAEKIKSLNKSLSKILYFKNYTSPLAKTGSLYHVSILFHR